MKFYAYRKYDFTGDLFEIVPDHETEAGTTPVFRKQVNFHFVNDPDSLRMIGYIEEPVPVPSVISGITDPSGNKFMGDTQYLITRVEPVFSVWNTFEYYKLVMAVNEYHYIGDA